MTGFELTASIIGSVAWPLVIGILVILLRKQLISAATAITKRIGDITEVSGAGVSVKLEKEIQDAVDKSESITETTRVVPPTTPTPTTVAPPEGGGESDSRSAKNPPDEKPEPKRDDGDDGFRVRMGSYWENLPPESPDERAVRWRHLAVDEPNAAILVAFSELEGLARRIYVHRYGAEDRFVGFRKIVKTFQRDKLLPDEVATLLLDLSDIRNEVSHTEIRMTSKMAENYIEAVGNTVGFLVRADVPENEQPAG